MSRFFVQAENGVGPGGDIIFRKSKGNSRWYYLYLNDTKIGTVMKSARGSDSWTGVSNARQSEWFAIRKMEGFATRMSAATFIINHHGYWLRDERESEASSVRAEKFLIKMKMNKMLDILTKGNTVYAIRSNASKD